MSESRVSRRVGDRSHAQKPDEKRMMSLGLLGALMSLIPDAALACDAGGSIISVNQRAERLFRYPSGTLAGLSVETLVADRSRDRGRGRSVAFLGSTRDHPMGTSLQLTGLRRDGSEFPMDISFVPISSESSSLVVAAFRDLDGSSEARREPIRALDEEHCRRQQAATAEIRLALLSAATLEENLRLICQRSSELSESPVVTVCAAGREGVRIVAGVGLAPGLLGVVLPGGQSFAEHVIERGEEVQLARRSDGPSATVLTTLPDGPTYGLPIVVDDEPIGAMTFVRRPGAGSFGVSTRLFAKTLVEQAALALELERARRDRERLVVVADRERIARDLHDHVIQRIFSAGMDLQGALQESDEHATQDVLTRTVGLLDEVIRDIRTTIFALSRGGGEGKGPRARILELAQGYRSALGFPPSVVFDGSVDARVPDHLVHEVIACMHEALSNVARHAHATAVRVEVAADQDAVSLVVVDDGVGIGTPGRRSGLSNLAVRAQLAGGVFEVLPEPAGGTRLVWRAPIRERSHVS